MTLFVTSKSTVNRHGVFAIERTPTPLIKPIGTGVVGMVGLFPWGPDQSIFQPVDAADRALTLAPPGMDRLNQAYLATIGKAWPDLRTVRPTGAGKAKATATLASITPTNIVTVTMKYNGSAGNTTSGTTAIVSDASDGNANHFDLTVRVTGASGTTDDILRNLNFSGIGTDTVLTAQQLNQLRLVGGLTKLASGRPVNASYNFTGGADGTINAAAWTGTAGTGDAGIACFENDDEIEVLFAGDPGDALRSNVMEGIEAQCAAMLDRIGIVHGDSGLTLAAVQTDVGSYQSVDRIVYPDGWVYVFDDTSGALQLVPSSSFMASDISNVSPSTSPAWKSKEVQRLKAAIQSLETPRGIGVGSNTQKGICTLIKEKGGGYSWEAGVLSVAPTSPAIRNITRRRMGDYIAKGFVNANRDFVDAPNVPLNQGMLVAGLTRFMDALKRAQNTDPNHTVHVLDYAIPELRQYNPQQELAAGDFTVPLDCQTSSSMERIFLSFRWGETVTVTAI